ncbi:MAG: hypothetical protein GEU77_18945 [Deltaproteobacteria bacterium]|nr:hypothetical protein [Deltaproteobacteria bacterium]
MKEEIELGWLKLTDKSDLVLTTRYVFQQQDSGIFGESRAIIPRRAISSVRISWQRSQGAVILGAFLILCYLVLLVGGLIVEPTGISLSERVLHLSSSTLSFIQYVLLISGLGLLALFWLYKRCEIQIAAAGGSLGGTPRNYDDAETFCSLLVSPRSEPPAPIKDAEQKVESSPKTTDRDWKL